MKELAVEVDIMEQAMLQLPQVECSVEHIFGDGIYIRQVTLPAGAMVIGHFQKTVHMNIMIKGKVMMPDGNGGSKILSAPMTFQGSQGRKVGYVLEEVLWQNVYATHETDIDKLEATYLDKSPAWEQYYEELDAITTSLRQPDRDSFATSLSLRNLKASDVREQSERTEDLIPFPSGTTTSLKVRKSFIEGKGIFSTISAKAGDILAPARLNGMRTPAGRYTNHSHRPNAEMVWQGDDIYLIATRDIVGCMGGGQGEEITIDYDKTLSLGDNR